VTPQEAVTLPNNFVTVFHSVTTDLALPLPWPIPSSSSPAPEHAKTPILIWGASSSVGQFALQILSAYHYTALFATSSPQHFPLLRSYGAKHTFDYRSPDVVEQILEAAGGEVPLMLDCIGSSRGSLKPIRDIAKSGARVAVLLPVIVKDAGEGENERPVYEMDVKKVADWEEGVDVRGVRTHFYLNVRIPWFSMPFRLPFSTLPVL